MAEQAAAVKLRWFGHGAVIARALGVRLKSLQAWSVVPKEALGLLSLPSLTCDCLPPASVTNPGVG